MKNKRTKNESFKNVQIHTLKNKKTILMIILLSIIILSVYIINSRTLLNNIFNQGKKETVELLSYSVYDNQNNEKIKTLITINSENGIEYIETPDGNKIYANKNNKISIDYIIKKDEEKIFKIKEVNKEEKEERIIITNDIIKEAINIDSILETEGYKTLKISSNTNMNGFKTYYQIGKNGKWVEGKGKISILDYDVTTNNLINEDKTITISAMIKNNDTKDIVSISRDYDVDTSSTLNSFEADSLIAAMEKYDFGTGVFKVKVSDETYNLKIYSFDEGLEINSDTEFGTEEDVGAENKYAQNMIVLKVNGDLTINQGATLTSYASKTGHGGPKGMMIYTTGTLTNNGTISMTARGAYAEGQNVYLWKNSNESYEFVPAIGANGGDEFVVRKNEHGRPGQNGTNRATGGGGTGGAVLYDIAMKVSKAGSGTSYSGGTGSGGASNNYVTSDPGSDIGGNGGNGGFNQRSGTRFAMAGGGAGNPTGISYPTSEPYYAKYNADIINGTGGLLTLYADNIKNNGNITANGIGLKNLVTNITGSWGNYNAPGGSSGGGSINIFYKTSCEQGNLTANGGDSAVGHVKSRKWRNRINFNRKYKYWNLSKYLY